MTPASAIIGMIALSINMREDKLILTEEELSTIQNLTAEEMAEVEAHCRGRATRWLESLRQVKAIANGREAVASSG
jgi:hypothetical protein